MAKKMKKSKKVKADMLEQAKESIDTEEIAAIDAAPAEEDVEPKAEAKKPGRKAMTAEEKAAAAKAREEEKEKAAAMTPTLTLQYGGKDVDVKALVQAAKDDFKAEHKRTLLTQLDLYLKPEDGTLYYVANGDVEGKVTF